MIGMQRRHEWNRAIELFCSLTTHHTTSLRQIITAVYSEPLADSSTDFSFLLLTAFLVRNCVLSYDPAVRARLFADHTGLNQATLWTFLFSV